MLWERSLPAPPQQASPSPQPTPGYSGKFCTNQRKLPLFWAEQEVVSDIWMGFRPCPQRPIVRWVKGEAELPRDMIAWAALFLKERVFCYLYTAGLKTREAPRLHCLACCSPSVQQETHVASGAKCLHHWSLLMLKLEVSAPQGWQMETKVGSAGPGRYNMAGARRAHLSYQGVAGLLESAPQKLSIL